MPLYFIPIQAEISTDVQFSQYRHLRRVMHEYIEFFNTARPHQGIVQLIPVPAINLETNGPARCRNVLGGIIHNYYRDAD